MKQLERIVAKESRIAIGLMSGTSLDGMDAALVRLEGWGTGVRARLLAFETYPYPAALQEEILRVALGDSGGSRSICRLNSLVGHLSAEACLALCEKASLPPEEVDFVGSHGQTVFHIPQPEPYLGRMVTGSLQIGEASIIAEAMGCPVVSDFRVRDMATGGQGAPLVPYTEYLLYRSEAETVALQNIGGIGNVTILPAGCSLDQVVAFDTGPGNMLVNAAVLRITKGEQSYDRDGNLARSGAVSEPLLGWLLGKDEAYLRLPPPKSTGREYYNDRYVDDVFSRARELALGEEDLVATLTAYTARAIGVGIERFAPAAPDRLIIGGGGARNPVMVEHVRRALPGCRVLVGEEAGIDSDAKEAVAFAVLANETLHGQPGNAPSATGASHPVVLGKITL